MFASNIINRFNCVDYWCYLFWHRGLRPLAGVLALASRWAETAPRPRSKNKMKDFQSEIQWLKNASVFGPLLGNQAFLLSKTEGREVFNIKNFKFHLLRIYLSRGNRVQNSNESMRPGMDSTRFCHRIMNYFRVSVSWMKKAHLSSFLLL